MAKVVASVSAPASATRPVAAWATRQQAWPQQAWQQQACVLRPASLKAPLPIRASFFRARARRVLVSVLHEKGSEGVHRDGRLAAHSRRGKRWASGPNGNAAVLAGRL